LLVVSDEAPGIIRVDFLAHLLALLALPVEQR
jgi:hypothetical protein